MKISKIRSALYRTASILGDVQAVKSGDPKKILKRVGRKHAHKTTGRAINRLFK